MISYKGRANSRNSTSMKPNFINSDIHTQTGMLIHFNDTGVHACYGIIYYLDWLLNDNNGYKDLVRNSAQVLVEPAGVDLALGIQQSVVTLTLINNAWEYGRLDLVSTICWLIFTWLICNVIQYMVILLSSDYVAIRYYIK